MTSKEETSEEKSTYAPIIVTVGVSIILVGLLLFFPIAIVGVAILAAALVILFKDGAKEKFAGEKEEPEEKFPMESVSKEKLGLWVFLTSEILIFGSLIVAYVYVRVNSSTWPVAAEIHNVILGMTNTIILLTSSLAIVLALYFVKSGNLKGLRIGLVSTFALGIVFLVIKFGFEWPELIHNGFTITNGLPASSYYVLTGLHGMHVAAGLVAIGYLMYRANLGGFTNTKHVAVENVGLYWHFVDIVWMFLFPLFYLI